jgi:anti-sigma regulatory factor (Ser/Thr protein kinase)
MNELSFQVGGHEEIRAALQLARTAINHFAFPSYEAANIELALSEMVTNAIRYAGQADVSVRETQNNKGIELVIADQGPGIADIDLAMKDGYSTSDFGSLGLGFGAAKRCVDEMQIKTSTQGTTIRLRHFYRLSGTDIDIGVASFPAVGEHLNGDRYVIKEYEGDKVIAAVIDGSGHGQSAHSAATEVAVLIQDNHREPIADLLAMGHQRLLEKRLVGAEVAIARVTDKTIEYGAVGNVNSSLRCEPKASLKINNGCLGLSMPKRLLVDTLTRPTDFVLALFSDGIECQSCLDQFAPMESAQQLAEAIFNRHAISTDDATIILLHG